MGTGDWNIQTPPLICPWVHSTVCIIRFGTCNRHKLNRSEYVSLVGSKLLLLLAEGIIRSGKGCLKMFLKIKRTELHILQTCSSTLIGYSPFPRWAACPHMSVRNILSRLSPCWFEMCSNRDKNMQGMRFKRSSNFRTIWWWLQQIFWSQILEYKGQDVVVITCWVWNCFGAVCKNVASGMICWRNVCIRFHCEGALEPTPPLMRLPDALSIDADLSLGAPFSFFTDLSLRSRVSNCIDKIHESLIRNLLN